MLTNLVTTIALLLLAGCDVPDGKRDFYVDCQNNSWSMNNYKYRATSAEEAVDMARGQWGDQLHPDDPPVCFVRSYHKPETPK